MLVLDTDHLSHFDEATTVGGRLKGAIALKQRRTSCDHNIHGRTITRLARADSSNHSNPHAAIPIYTRLQRRLEFYARWTALPWDTSSADLFAQLHAEGVRIGSMDLKIACITIINRGTLLIRNAKEFSKAPGLRFENWLD